MASLSELPVAYTAFLAFVFGLLVGSFLNVVIHRVPLGDSIVFPGSHCPQCGTPLRPADNVPLLSFALLRGRCRNCRTRISLIYPLVELTTGAVFLLLVLKDGVTGVTAAEMWFAATMIVLMVIDARHHLLPDAISIPSVLIALVCVALLGWTGQMRKWPLEMPWLESLTGEPRKWIMAFTGLMTFAAAVPLLRALGVVDTVLFGKYLEWDQTSEEPAPSSRMTARLSTWIAGGLLAGVAWVVLVWTCDSENMRLSIAFASLARGAVGALAGGAVLWIIRALYFYIRGIEGMGLGDVKLLALVGAFLSWQGAIRTLFIGVVLALVGGLVIASRTRRGWKTAVPLGLFLGIAALIVLFTGEAIELWYWGR
jgi:prepilin signal peptidase PulO-like enzyme (type II secretory pathway)